MPVLKQIAGHGSSVPVQKYLERNGRALARDFFGFDEVDDTALDAPFPEEVPFEWAQSMDEFRAGCGNDRPWKGQKARTFKHFVISPAPEDAIDLYALRELAHAWVEKYFADFQVAIVYHDDNASRLPHAHVVVNNTNVATGRRMHHDDPKELNRGLQQLARERGLSALSNEAPEPESGFERLADEKGPGKDERPATLQAEYRGRTERAIEKEGGYSWVADIRNRVCVAKGLARNEAEFERILQMMGVDMADNSARAKRPDWVFSLADTPTRRVSGERLGMAFGKEALTRSFMRPASECLADLPSREILRRAKSAVELRNLGELDRLADVLDACSKWRITSVDAATTTIVAERARLDSATSEHQKGRIRENIARLEQARAFVKETNILPLHDTRRGSSHGSGNWNSDAASGGGSIPTRDIARNERGGWHR